MEFNKLPKTPLEIKENDDCWDQDQNKFSDCDMTIFIYNYKTVWIDIHPKLFKNTNGKLLITDGEEFKLNQHQQNIIDINTTTKYQSCDEIKQMSLNLLNLNDIQLNLNKSQTIFPSEQNSYENVSLNLNNDETFGLLNRTKGEKLNKEQLNFLRNEINNSRLTAAELSRKYFITPSTLSKLKHLSSSDIKSLPHRKVNKITNDQRSEIKQQIKEYYNQTETEFVSYDVQKYLFDKLNLIWSNKTIIDIMKNDLNLSFKRWLTRPNTINFDKI